MHCTCFTVLNQALILISIPTMLESVPQHPMFHDDWLTTLMYQLPQQEPRSTLQTEAQLTVTNNGLIVASNAPHASAVEPQTYDKTHAETGTCRWILNKARSSTGPCFVNGTQSVPRLNRTMRLCSTNCTHAFPEYI